jgi:dihydrofolate reductase
MRQVSVFESVSLDGFFTDANNDMSWAHQHDPEWDAWVAGNAQGGGALLFGRVTYEMMQSAWRRPATGTWPDWMGASELPFAEAIDRARKHVASSTLTEVDWNAELMRGDLADAVRRLKEEPGEGLFVGGVTLPLALADLGLIDEYAFVVQPVLAGHGPTLLSGLRERIRLELVDRQDFRSGAVALRYRPTRAVAGQDGRT